MVNLSIIVPLYKSEQYLPKCIESLVHQDIPFDEYEIILVNDGSPDNSLAIAESYAAQYHNIKVITQENKGASGARNTGMGLATGTYVRFVDPDDYVPENSFKQFLDQMESEQLDMLRFNYQMVDEQYNPIEKPASALRIDYSNGVLSGGDFLAERLGFACFIWTFVFRRSIISDNNIHFYEGDYYDDTPWTPRVCLKAGRVNSVDAIGYYYYQRSNSLVKDVSREAILKKLEGHKFLIEDLTKQRNNTEHAGAKRWYDGMIAHCAVSVLNSVSRNYYDTVPITISFLKQLRVFPLSSYFAEPKTARKIQLINICPKLYCMLLHFKFN